MLPRWSLIVPIVALPTYSFAQVQSGLRSGAPLSGVRSGYDYRYNYNYFQHRSYRPAYSNCWRVTRVRGSTIIWNCQPYPPPSP